MRMLAACCASLLLWVASPGHGAAPAAHPELETTAAEPPVRGAHPGGIGLVLGGGGARGAAHIGVLKVLERERIPIAYIAGTSMGSIIGSLYAAGYTPDELEAIVGAIDWKDMLEDDPSRIDMPMRRKDDTLRYLLDFKLGVRDGKVQLPRGAIQGQKLLLLLRRLLLPTWQVTDFDRLPIPFRCVATDIVRGEPVVFEGGDLAVAVRASMSVPAAFAPIRVDGRLLVDGGLVNNVPYDVAKAMGATRVIAVDVGTPLLEDKDLNSPIAITMQMITAVTQKLTDQILAGMGPGDLLIKPQLGDIGSGSFDRSVEAIPLGEAAAEAMVRQLRAYSVGEAEYAAWRAGISHHDFDPPLVAFVDTVTTRSKSAGYVDRLVRDNAGEPLDLDRLEDDLGEAYGAGQYERIAWRLTEDEQGHTGIEVLPVDKGWGPGFLTFGLQISDNFDGLSDYQLTAEFTQTGLNRYGAEWRTLLGIGRVAAFRTEWYQPMGQLGQFYVEPYLDYRASNQPLTLDSQQVAEYRVARTRLGVDLGWNPSQIDRVYVGLQRGIDEGKLRVGDPQSFGDERDDIGAYTVGFTHDTLDDADFPGQGSRIDLRGEIYRDYLGSDSNTEVARASLDWAASRGKHKLLLGARGSTFYGEDAFLSSVGFLGGFLNLSGYGERELFGTTTLLGRSVYYRRLTDDSRLFSVPVYAGASLEAGNVFLSRSEVGWDEMIFAGSAFVGVDTFFGPIFLGYGHADTGDSSWYLTFGSLLRPSF